MLLSRDENNPEGPVEAKVVEEVFVRVGRVLNLKVAGRVIGTTGEHPFWVRGKGWLPAAEIIAGDHLLGHDGRWTVVEDKQDTGENQVVYNMRVAEFHTYFVGSAEWGFSVWSHNIRCGEKLSKADEKELLKQVGMKEVRAPSGKGMQNPAVRAAAEKGDIAHAIVQDKMRAKGWLVDRADTGVVDPRTGKMVYPDAITLQGHPVEIKPRTPSGVAAGESQLVAYERATGRRGRVVFYDPDDF